MPDLAGEGRRRRRIRIEVLGPFRVLDDEGRPLEIPRGKLTGLLAYLAVETHGVERDSLEAMFWPDASPAARRQSLRQALYSLRKILDLDPFVVEERVRLDEALCRIDYREFRDTLWRDDPERCLAAVRGIPFTDVPPDVSVAFEHWLERRRADAMQRLARLAEGLGREALDEGDEATVRRTLRLGIRAGLKEDALTAAIYGPHGPRPSWAAATVGVSGLETLVYRARSGLPSMVALVLETTQGWAGRAVSNRVAELPPEGRPALLALARGDGEGEEVAEVLAGLLELPGGAAVRERTVEVVQRLRSVDGMVELEERRAEVEAALADALDAVLHEQALILTLGATGIRYYTAGLLARAMALQGGEGLTVIVAGGSEQDLSALPAQTLVQTARELRHVREIGGMDADKGRARPVADGLPADHPSVAPDGGDDPRGGETPVASRGQGTGDGPAGGDDPVGGEKPRGGEVSQGGEIPWGGGVPWRGGPSWSRGRAALLGAAILVLVAAGVSMLLPGEAGPLTSYDIVFCSPRSGIPQYYLWSSQTGVVERFSADTAAYVVRDGQALCRGETVVASADSVRLAVRSGAGFGWRSYPYVRSRRDLVADGPLIAPSDMPVPPLFVGEGSRILQHEPSGGWRAIDLAGGETTPLRLLQADDRLSSWTGPWVVFGRAGVNGSQDLFRVHTRSGAVERLTSGPLDQSWGTVRNDSLLFAQGPMGDAEDGSLEIVLRDLRTGEETRLTHNDWNDYEVRWSPTGRHICWQAEELGHYQSEIMVMDLRAGRSWNLSRSPGRDFQCRFTPDGRAVVYRSLRTGDADLIIQPVEGGPAENLTFFAGEDVLAGFVGNGGQGRAIR